MRYGSKWPIYAEQWDEMVINPSRLAEFTKYAQFAIAHKTEYLAIEKATGVTWPHVAVLHRRESDADFNTYLGNGEPLNRVTRLVPEGRGPFPSFIAGAIDALGVDGLDKVADWRLEKILYYCEIFNGAGYHNKGLPSPYLWGGTNQQRPGKYISDGNFDPNVMDTQPGCAPILQMIAKLDPSVKFVRETPMGVEPSITPEPPMADADMKALVGAVEGLVGAVASLRSDVATTKMEIATLRSLVTGEPVKPVDPPKPPEPKPSVPVVLAPPPVDPVNTARATDFRTFLLSAISAIALPAAGVTATVDQGTVGSLLPFVGMAASALGIPSWILPLAGRLIGGLLPSQPGASK